MNFSKLKFVLLLLSCPFFSVGQIVKNTLAKPSIFKQQAADKIDFYNAKLIYDIEQQQMPFPFSNSKKGKEESYKIGERLRWFSAPRYYPSGKPNLANNDFDEWQRYQEKYNKLKNFNDVGGNWQLVGPLSIPKSIDTTSLNINGMGRITCIAFQRDYAPAMWVGSSSGGIWKTVNSGKSWVNITGSIPSMNISDIAIDPYDPAYMYVATGDWDNGKTGKGLFKTTDGGSHWYKMDLLPLNNEASASIKRVLIQQREDAQILIGGYGIHRSDDAGYHWKTISENYILDLQEDKSNNNILYTATFGDTSLVIKKSIDFGNTWQDLSLHIPFNVGNIRIALSPRNPNLIYVATADIFTWGFDALYRSTDSGKTWEERGNKTQINPLGYYMGDSTDVGGQAYYDFLLAVDPQNDDRVFIGGVDTWGSNDGGKTFQKQLTGKKLLVKVFILGSMLLLFIHLPMRFLLLQTAASTKQLILTSPMLKVLPLALTKKKIPFREIFYLDMPNPAATNCLPNGKT